MDKSKRSVHSGYFCQCKNVFVPKDQIKYHLKLQLKHKISKVDQPKVTLQDFDESIMKRIQALRDIQAQIQQTSAELMQKIIQNTILAVAKIEDFIQIYKGMMITPPDALVPEMIKKQIVSNYRLEESFCSAFIKHFDQDFAAESWTTDEMVKRTKSKFSHIFEKQCDSFLCMAISNDEKFIVTGGREGAIRVWNLTNKVQTFFVIGHKAAVNSLALASDNCLLLSGSGDSTVRLWNLKVQKQTHKFAGHTDVVFSVLISSDNKTGFSGSFDKTIRLWNLEKKTNSSILTFTFRIFQISLIDSDQIIVAVGAGLTFCKIKTQAMKDFKLNNSHEASSICFVKGEKEFIIGFGDGVVQIWNSTNSKKLFEERKHSGPITKICICSESKYFATSSWDTKVLIWDFEKKTVVQSIPTKSNMASVYSMKFSQCFAYCHGPSIFYYEVKSQKTKQLVNQKLLENHQVAISRELEFLAYGTFEIRLFDLENLRKIARIPVYGKECSVLRFSPDSSLLGSGYFNGEVVILRVPSLTQTHRFCLSQSFVGNLAISPNNLLIGCGYNETKVLIQSLENQKVVYTEQTTSFRDAVFCLKSEYFIYTDEWNICVVDKSYIKIKEIKFDFVPLSLIFDESNRNVSVLDSGKHGIAVDLGSLEILFEKKTRKDFKEWHKAEKNFKIETFLRLPILFFS